MLSGAFAWSCTGPCEKLLKLVQVLVRRSCGDLLKSSSRGPCIKILKILCIGAHRKFLYEDLLSSSIKIYIECSAAVVAIMSNLICYCSIATVACIWYVDFPPPLLFGVSCRCYLSLGIMDVCSPSHRAISFDPSPDIKASTIVDEDHREGRCLLSAAKAKPPRNTFLCFHGGFHSQKKSGI